MKTLTCFLAAAGAALVLSAFAGAAEAYPDRAAGVDSQIRPNFGGLIQPPVRPQWRPDRRRGPGKGGKPPLPPKRDQYNIAVDCSIETESGTPINDALRRLADYGKLYISGTCHETVEIMHPAILIGEGASVFDEGSPRLATIAPLDGDACILIGDGVEAVEIRDLILTTEKGGRSACVESYGANVALVRSKVIYWGDAPAVFASGGKLILRESVIDGRTWDAAVVADGSLVEIFRTRISGEETGVDLTLADGESSIRESGIMYRSAAAPSGVGVLVRGQRSGSGVLSVENSVVCGWRNGVNIDRGGIVNIKRSRLCRNQVGIVSDGELSLLESAIGAKDVGVYVASGRATILRNRFYDWTRTPIWISQGRPVISGEGPEVEANWAYFGAPPNCWDRVWDDGVYCKTYATLPPGIRDESVFDNRYRDWWEADGYDRGYIRDGAPTIILPRPTPPKPTTTRRPFFRRPR